MNNFKNTVPANVQTKLKELAELINDDFRSIRSNHGESQTGESRLDEIQGNYVSGWMPRQDGGFEISEWMHSDIDSSYHFTEKQTEWINDQQKQCFVAFLADNKMSEEEFNAQYDLETGSEEFRQAFCEYEGEWFQDGALLQVQLFAEGYNGKLFDWDKDPEKIITIRVSINYEDEQCREKYAEDIKQIVLSESEFIDTPNDVIIEQIKF